MDHLKERITEEIKAIPIEMFTKAVAAFPKRLKMLQSNGGAPVEPYYK